MKSLIIYLFEAERKGENTADNMRKIYLTNYQRIKTIKKREEKVLQDSFYIKQRKKYTYPYKKTFAGENSRNAFKGVF